MKQLKSLCIILSLILTLNFVFPTITKAQNLNSGKLQTTSAIQPPQEVVVFPGGPRVFKAFKLAPTLIPLIKTVVDTANELLDLFNKYLPHNKTSYTEGYDTKDVGAAKRNYDFNIYNRDNYVGYGYANNPERVKDVQTILNGRMNAGLAEDGVFGSRTNAAIKSFQSYWGLPADGIVGPTTWLVLISDRK